MAKLTINDKEVYTDDFNEEQNKIFSEVQMLSSEIYRLEYQAALMKSRQQILAEMLLPKDLKDGDIDSDDQSE
jgi:hypothetical protein|tara:strand:- start:652 stop:870 length:219 start_codon:yes stop_codon:yes gene_type:complete